MKRIICILFCLALLLCCASAAEKTPLEQKFDSFIQRNGLSKENFSLSFFNTVSGETYTYNDGKMFSIGQVWTLPLHMYYALEEHKGSFEPKENSPEALDPNYEYTINGMNLDTCRIESIINGNESVSKAMCDAVPQYKNVINEEFGHLSEHELNAQYRDENCYSARFLMNCMIELTRESEIYGELMRMYDMVSQPEGFFASENSAASQYRTVQLRGQENGYVCAVAEISTASPYLIVAIISEEAGGDALLAALNDMIADYVESTNGKPQEESTEPTQHDDSIFKVNSKLADKTPVIKTIAIILGALAVVTIIAIVIYRVIRRREY